jgi:hypothetical protein
MVLVSCLVHQWQVSRGKKKNLHLKEIIDPSPKVLPSPASFRLFRVNSKHNRDCKFCVTRSCTGRWTITVNPTSSRSELRSRYGHGNLQSIGNKLGKDFSWTTMNEWHSKDRNKSLTRHIQFVPHSRVTERTEQGNLFCTDAHRMPLPCSLKLSSHNTHSCLNIEIIYMPSHFTRNKMRVQNKMITGKHLGQQAKAYNITQHHYQITTHHTT